MAIQPDLSRLLFLCRYIFLDERAVSSQLLGERIDPAELDSGRNIGEGVEEEDMYDNDPMIDNAGSDGGGIAEVEVQLATRKRGGNRR